MTETHVPLPSLADRVRPVAVGGTVVGVHFLGPVPVFVLGEETLLFAGDDDERRIAVHGGGILVSVCDGTRIVTGGDDGRLVATEASGEPREIAVDAKRRWIDQVALAPNGEVAWSAGKTAHVLTRKGEERTFEAPSTVAGLAFAPKGLRLAIAHYNGATLWFPNAAGAEPQKLEWKSSHRRGHDQPGWAFRRHRHAGVGAARLEASPKRKHMRMTGYSARVRSLVVERGRRIPRHFRLRATHPLAFRRQEWSDGPPAEALGARPKRGWPLLPAIRASR